MPTLAAADAPMEVDETNSNNNKRPMEQDDESASNPATAATTPTSSAKKQKKKKTTSVFNTDLLRVYYQRLFPYDEMFRWLSYGHDPAKAGENAGVDKTFFLRREFSFTIENDVYIRYLSFRDKDEMLKEIQKKQPHKIDIGAVYSVPPKNHATVKSSAFKPLERELVFDIDLTDYDDVRVGCTPDMMWERGSWLYMSVAVKIIDRALREDFGFEHLLWVFSGRRGVHCWVCDERARALEDRERDAIVNYLTLISGSDGNKVDLSAPLHPSIQQAMPELERVFNRMVLSPEGQDLLADSARQEKVLRLIPNQSVQEVLRAEWQKDKTSTSEKRWKQLRATVIHESKRQKAADSRALKKCLQTIVIMHVYPRLDVNVSTHRNHLLKSPFVIHPKTGKVCVPILDVANCDAFDPDAVPTLATLTEEMDRLAAAPDFDSSAEGIQWNRLTSIKPYVEGFESGFLKPLYRSVRKTFQDAAQADAAAKGEW